MNAEYVGHFLATGWFRSDTDSGRMNHTDCADDGARTFEPEALAECCLLYGRNPQRQQGTLDHPQHDTPLLTLRVSTVSRIGRSPRLLVFHPSSRCRRQAPWTQQLEQTALGIRPSITAWTPSGI